MRGYIILNINVLGAERYSDYIGMGPATIAHYGGKYLAGGGQATSPERNLPVHRLVMLEFDSHAKAEEWWNSKAYRACRNWCGKALPPATFSSWKRCEPTENRGPWSMPVWREIWRI